MAGFFRQIWAVSAMNLAALPLRAGASLVTIVGVATVVAVMLSLLGIGAGVMGSVVSNDRPDQAMVLSSGATELMGSFSQADVAQIDGAPGIARAPNGKPVVQPRAVVIVELENKTGGANNVGFVGSGEMGDLMNKGSQQIFQGRLYTAGLHELIAGRRAQAQYKHLQVGDTVMLRGAPWKVVGAYKDKGGVDENGIVTDADTLLAAFNRTSYQSVEVELSSPASFREFKDAITSNPQLQQVQVKRLAEYYRDQLKPLTNLLAFIGYFVGGVMAVGVVFGALNTMYSAVDARKREIATLRALGFGATAVVVSVILESLALAIPGALLGAAVAWLLFNNHDVHMGGVSFPLAVTPDLVVLGLVWALVIGLIGGFTPAIRAARLPVAEALRST
jgi:putative ABC transport system permease protein